MSPTTAQVLDLRIREKALEAKLQTVTDRAAELEAAGNGGAAAILGDVRRALGQGYAALSQAARSERYRSELLAIGDCYASVAANLERIALGRLS